MLEQSILFKKSDKLFGFYLTETMKCTMELFTTHLSLVDCMAFSYSEHNQSVSRTYCFLAKTNMHSGKPKVVSA